MPNTEFQPCRRSVRNDLVERKIKNCRISSKKNFRIQKKVRIRP